MSPSPVVVQQDYTRIWYLLLQIGVPFNISGFDPARHFRVVRRESKQLGVMDARQLSVALQDNADRLPGRYLFRFHHYTENDAAASRLAECFVYGLSLFHGPLANPHEDSLFMRVANSFIDGKECVLFEDLVEHEKSKHFDKRTVNYPAQTIGLASSTTPDLHEAAWRAAAVTFDNDSLFDATRFLSESYLNFYVHPGQIREVAEDPDAVARTGSEQTQFEEALQNAFKAVEAVVGDPPKDDRKFFRKLNAVGIDPLEPAGYGEKRPISEVIRRMSEARDKSAAHGSMRNRRIGAADLLGYQACASIVVLAALETARGGGLWVPPDWSDR